MFVSRFVINIHIMLQHKTQCIYSRLYVYTHKHTHTDTYICTYKHKNKQKSGFFCLLAIGLFLFIYFFYFYLFMQVIQVFLNGASISLCREEKLPRKEMVKRTNPKQNKTKLKNNTIRLCPCSGQWDRRSTSVLTEL